MPVAEWRLIMYSVMFVCLCVIISCKISQKLIFAKSIAAIPQTRTLEMINF